MNTTCERYIDVTDEAMGKLSDAFGCTRKMVYLALTYRKGSELARRIRYTAVREFGGKPMRHCAECDTLYLVTEEGRKLMRQNFDNGAVLDVDRATGDATLKDRYGAEAGRWQHVNLSQLTGIQLMAESL